MIHNNAGVCEKKGRNQLKHQDVVKKLVAKNAAGPKVTEFQRAGQASRK